MVQKLKAVRDALHDPDFVVIARTDAIAVEGFDAALDRAAAYIEAGADMIFVEAPTSEAEIADIAKRLPGLKLINMFAGGKTPLLPVPKLEAFGYHARHHSERHPARRHQGHAARAGRDCPRRQRGIDGGRYGLVQGTRGGYRHAPPISNATSVMRAEHARSLTSGACS